MLSQYICMIHSGKLLTLILSRPFVSVLEVWQVGGCCHWRLPASVKQPVALCALQQWKWILGSSAGESVCQVCKRLTIGFYNQLHMWHLLKTFFCVLQGVWLIRRHECRVTVRGLQRFLWRCAHDLQTQAGPWFFPWWGAVALTEQSHRLQVNDLLWNCTERGKNQFLREKNWKKSNSLG